MEAISASERARHRVPEAENIMPQTRATGPPFCRPSWKLVATPSHDDRRVMDIPEDREGGEVSLYNEPLVLSVSARGVINLESPAELRFSGHHKTVQ